MAEVPPLFRYKGTVVLTRHVSVMAVSQHEAEQLVKEMVSDTSDPEWDLQEISLSRKAVLWS